MKKILISFILSLFLITTADIQVSADILVAEHSATLNQKAESEDYRIKILKDFFVGYNSPLALYAEVFIQAADENELDWRLIPAITGVESTFGKNIPHNSFNAYGWANGVYTFRSWEESIFIVADKLRDNYIDKGAITISQIGRIYAPPSLTWAYKVKLFMNKIDPLPLGYSI
jgi:hypothetical protein